MVKERGDLRPLLSITPLAEARANDNDLVVNDGPRLLVDDAMVDGHVAITGGDEEPEGLGGGGGLDTV